MEYLGLAGAWKKLEGFAVSEPTTLVFVVLGVAAALILAVNWLLKK